VDEQTAVAPTLPRAVVVLLGAAGAVIVIAGMRGSADLVGPIMLALVLTLAVAPLGHWARRHGWPGWLATLLIIVAAYGIVAVLAIGLAYSVVQLATVLPDYVDDAQDVLKQAQDTLAKLGFDADPTGTALSQLDLGRLADAVTSLLSTTLDVLGSLFFLVTLLFFLGAEANAWTHGVGKGIADGAPRLAASLHRFGWATQQYLLVSAGFGAVVAVLDGIALWLLGIPLAGVWAMLAFVTNFVPNIGFVIGVIPPAVLGLLVNGWEGLLAVVLVYTALNVVIQTFIQPRVVGDAVNLGTAITFMSVAFWTFVIGPLGALLAVPMTLLAKAIMVDADPQATVASAMLSSPAGRAAKPADEKPADAEPVDAEPADPAPEAVAESPRPAVS
jgi:predicted PurR-regulated permease PerM